MLSWNDFSAAHLGFVGASLAAFDKTAVMAASAGKIIPGAWTGTTNQLFGVVPTRQRVADADAFAVYNLGGRNFIGVLAWDGTQFKSAAIGITPTTPPPDALQPPGGTVIPGACNRPCVETGDDRIQSAVWAANTLWASLNDACDPGGGVRACVRFAELVVTDSSVQSVQEGDLGISGWDLYYPAADIDDAGHFAAVVTASNEFVSPSLAETGQSISLTRTNIFQGVTLLDHLPVEVIPPYTGQRWGDYSSAAIDPSNAGWVWVAGEETAVGTSLNWKTLLAPVNVANLGPSLGGTIAPATLENLGCCLQLGSGPAASSWGPGRLDVFMHGTNNALYHKWTATGGGGWSDWEFQGGVTMDGPAAVSWSPNHIDIFVRGTDNQLWHKWWDGSQWNGWEPLGGVLTSAPTVSTWGPGRLDVFAQGTDHGLWHKWYAGGWAAWESLGGFLSGSTAPGAVAWAPGRIDVVVSGTDAGIWHGWFDGQWHLYESLGGIMAGSPAYALGSRSPRHLGSRAWSLHSPVDLYTTDGMVAYHLSSRVGPNGWARRACWLGLLPPCPGVLNTRTSSLQGSTTTSTTLGLADRVRGQRSCSAKYHATSRPVMAATDRVLFDWRYFPISDHATKLRRGQDLINPRLAAMRATIVSIRVP